MKQKAEKQRTIDKVRERHPGIKKDIEEERKKKNRKGERNDRENTEKQRKTEKDRVHNTFIFVLILGIY